MGDSRVTPTLTPSGLTHLCASRGLTASHACSVSGSLWKPELRNPSGREAKPELQKHYRESQLGTAMPCPYPHAFQALGLRQDATQGYIVKPEVQKHYRVPTDVGRHTAWMWAATGGSPYNCWRPTVWKWWVEPPRAHQATSHSVFHWERERSRGAARGR